MLQPKRTKHRKMFRIRHDKVKAAKNNTVTFGEFGLKSTSSAWITARQIEAARIAITRKMGREGKVIIKIFPHMSKTSKPIGIRMGSGKGSPEEWLAVVKEGTVMFEVLGNNPGIMKEALRLGGHKLPVTWKIVSKQIEVSSQAAETKESK
ncbi:50S ribosomal protein L16 [Metamycoplasma hyosynoviae]|uniref:50S ribosomal protein L16 n=1 Tax=Metamycoplasma hyosynoviae TaxID=29559 RepID=UPI0020C83ACF|nr:50S ribosomal protein L16 [Metamycoplasma hyosynoviae]MDC8963148.1 50S ribosomal protein L16 [Metamycoplasma hyosynoviae]MDD1358900.1 50S ribosomal protein L16 [Metamycoplasma hyosynoviae]MDD1361587.1 50S ribosomal protein L16 [Metamycoplasma hyosynoviae]MDD1372173.1 50S ribosomal protein L16 [Metamycoplasma hyosynoviae]MDD7908259.1 50S ribosomal protein L16 [Metamycoplasma hyosynoviae]